MTHEEFVQKYRAGLIQAEVDQTLARRLLENSDLLPKRYRAAHYFWAWVWFLSFPLAAVCFIWVRWWVGLVVLLLALVLPRAIKKSAAGFVLEHALEDEKFYNIAVEKK